MSKIVVAGGTGFVGQGILEQLRQNPQYELVSISKTGGKPNNQLSGVRYLAADLNKDGVWQQECQEADWLIDCIGILLPNPIKHTSYEQNSLLPPIRLIGAIENSATKFLFINANASPLKKYMDTKRAIADFAKSRLNARAFNVYPGLVYDRTRQSTYYPALMLKWLIQRAHLSFLTKCRPVPRTTFAQEIEKIVNDQASELTQTIS
ncbi:hypothetical protein JOC36_000986 [Weissella uvarum]|uniref:NAD-dependent epimerase/dehydratase family protein n=1 Tax=Weissella uvarum TaxID=1479233 RepID=UPI0019600F6C|nr:NAD-dependent epimerase/dehydratase family protein [Weissella uvarum]MBM7617429.1 hypothetical protein [Weissella uvarum]MCM0595686.1 NAD-dependent epimerase/dehydratase family protein [Weissella uvarum]